MALADQHGLASIAFPAISTGIYGYPIESAARIAVVEVSAAMNTSQQIEKVIFCCFSDRDLTIYRRLLDEITAS
jgi:O-acetyl-ADP-ribose deacetylase (regulator of RNase III)